MRDGNVAQVYVIPSQGGQARRVTDNPKGGGFPDWSPDGRSLVFERTSAGTDSLYVMDASGGAEQRLTQGPGWAPKWSLDGTKVFFKREGEPASDIWEVRADGSSERPVTDLAGRRGGVGYERPSTDGKYLYFIWTEDLADLWVMDVVENE